MRWHTHHLLSETVDPIDGHQGRVAVMLLAIKPDVPRSTLVAALTHDLGERAVGDISRTVKRRRPEIAKAAAEIEEEEVERLFGGEIPYPPMSADQVSLLKLADLLDAYLWMIHHRPGIRFRAGWPEMRAFLEELADTLGVSAPVAALFETLDQRLAEGLYT